MGINTPTWSETIKKYGRWTSNENLVATLNGESTDNKNSRQERLNKTFQAALDAKKNWDMAAYEDYMKQIRNLDG